eukprot:Platyproteum_vivax@DN2248_c0_g1_i1.p1
MDLYQSLQCNVETKKFVSNADRDLVLGGLRRKMENKVCFDCSNRNPSWCSSSHGIFLCLDCATNHRGMGVHLSFVRSAEMDRFTHHQLMCMEIGGNSRARIYYKTQGHVVDYESKAAEKYRLQIHKEATDIIAKFRPELLEAELESKDTTNTLNKASSSSSNAVERSSPHGSHAHPIQPHKEVLKPKVVGPVSCTPVSTITTNQNVNQAATNKASVHAKKIDFDFDFDDEVFSGPAETKKKGHQSPIGGNSPMAQMPSKSSYSSTDFVTSMDNHENGEAMAHRLSKFQNATAISSNTFFDRPDLRDSSLAGIGSIAPSGGSPLSSAITSAKDLWHSFQSNIHK